MKQISLNRRSLIGAGAAALGAAAGLLPSGRALAAAGQGPVLIELFTSQGCSSCPPADALLAELAKRPDVVPLCYNVDYWDYIGWRDTLALPGNATRQKDYVKALGLTNPYTPQMVIDGMIDVAGSRRADVMARLESRLGATKPGTRVPLTLKRDGADLKIGVGGQVTPKAPVAAVWLARVLRTQNVTIGAGENRGRAITYVNVVRSLTAAARWTGEPLSLQLPARDPAVASDAAVVWVQTGAMGEVLAAAQIDTR